MLTKDQILEIMKAYEEAAEKAGKTVKTAVLYTEETGEAGELIVDNRKPEDLN